jgi:phospho-acceptor domain-containing protein
LGPFAGRIWKYQKCFLLRIARAAVFSVVGDGFMVNKKAANRRENPYHGRILNEFFSKPLKKRVVDTISALREFEKTGNKAIAYLSAWREGDPVLWYEYVPRRFIEILNCEYDNIAEVFRKHMVDRRIYHSLPVGGGISMEIENRTDIDGTVKKIREEGKRTGNIETVYKLDIPDRGIIWLKDLAAVEIFTNDRICLSHGCLIQVTKEMQAEETRIEKERLQVALEVAGGVCHELNQPLQNLSGLIDVVERNINADHSNYKQIQFIRKQLNRISEMTSKLMRITRYETRDYVAGTKIVDIDRSSTDEDA